MEHITMSKKELEPRLRSADARGYGRHVKLRRASQVKVFETLKNREITQREAAQISFFSAP